MEAHMASLFKRRSAKGSYWYIVYYLHGKVRMKSTRTSDKQLAKHLLEKFERDLLRIKEGLEPLDTFAPILLSEFTLLYLTERRKQGRSPKTVSMDKFCLERLTTYLGDCAFATITKSAVRHYRDHLAKTLRPASVSIELRTLRTACVWASEKPGTKYLRENPFSQKNLIPQPEHPKDPLCLSPDEKARFLEAVDDPEHKKLFLFYLLTAARRNEALDLSWGDIDLELKQITFRKTKTKRDRTIPISLELMQVVVSLDRSKPKPFPLKPDNVTRLFKRYTQRAGIRPEIHLHCLRHTVATDLVRKGVPMKKISELLGHSSIKTTEVYTHIVSDDLRDVADAITCTG